MTALSPAEARDELSSPPRVIGWMEQTYNRRRRQRALGWLTPVEFELAFSQRGELAV